MIAHVQLPKMIPAGKLAQRIWAVICDQHPDADIEEWFVEEIQPGFAAYIRHSCTETLKAVCTVLETSSDKDWDSTRRGIALQRVKVVYDKLMLQTTDQEVMLLESHLTPESQPLFVYEAALAEEIALDQLELSFWTLVFGTFLNADPTGWEVVFRKEAGVTLVKFGHPQKRHVDILTHAWRNSLHAYWDASRLQLAAFLAAEHLERGQQTNALCDAAVIPLFRNKTVH